MHNGLEVDRTEIDQQSHSQLMHWYTGQGDEKDERHSVRLVQHVKSEGKWFACDCLGKQIAPPLLAPAYLAMGSTYYLRRLTGENRPEHHEECPFFRSQLDYQPNIAKSAEKPPIKPVEGFFSVLTPLGEHLAQKPSEDKPPSPSKTVAPPKLARFLWTLMARAGVHDIRPPTEEVKPSIHQQFAAIREAAQGFTIAPKVPLIHHFYTHSRDLLSGKIYDRLLMTERYWPKSHPPQAFLVTYAKYANANGIVCSDGAITTTGPTDAPEHADAEGAHHQDTKAETTGATINPLSSPGTPSRKLIDEGPFLCIIAIGRPLEGGDYQPLRAYAQPILSGHHFTPVNTNAERTILSMLVDLQRETTKRGTPFGIYKPIFHIETAQGHCRPDFIIENTQGDGLFITTTGYANEEYQANIDLTLPRMRTLAPVLTIDLNELSQPTLLRHTLCDRILHHADHNPHA